MKVLNLYPKQIVDLYEPYTSRGYVSFVNHGRYLVSHVYTYTVELRDTGTGRICTIPKADIMQRRYVLVTSDHFMCQPVL